MASKRPSELKGIQTQYETFSEEADILHDEIKGIVRYSVKNPGFYVQIFLTRAMNYIFLILINWRKRVLHTLIETTINWFYSRV